MASISFMDIIKGDLQIYTLAFAAPDIHLSRETPDSPLNIQFIIDELSKEKKEEKRESKLRINQLIIYDGKFSYDILSEKYLADRFDPNHIAIGEFNCNLSLKDFDKKNLNLNIRSISGKEKSGLRLNKLKAHIQATDEGIQFSNMSIELPETRICSDNIYIKYDKEIFDSLSVKGEIIGEQFSINDIRPLLSKVPDDVPQLSFRFNGSVDHKSANGSISISNEESGFYIDATGSVIMPYSDSRQADLDIKELKINEENIKRILAFIGKEQFDISELAGDVKLSGKATLSKEELAADVSFVCRSGKATANVNIKNNGDYDIKAKGEQIRIGDIIKEQSFGSCNLEIASKGNFHGEGDYADFDAKIKSLQFLNYAYAPIDLSGKVGKGRIKANLVTKDNNINAKISLDYNKSRREVGKLTAEVLSFRPDKLNLTDKHADKTFSFNAEGSYKYTANNDRLIELKMSDLAYDDTKSKETVKKIVISETDTGKEKRLHIESDFINGDIYGEYEYKELAKTFMNAIGREIPALAATTKKMTDNIYAYELRINDTRFISKLFGLPFIINSPSCISGGCNDITGDFNLNAELNNVTLMGMEFPEAKIKGIINKEGITLNTDAKNRSYNKKGTPQESISETWVNLRTFTSRGQTSSTISWNSCENSSGEHGTLSIDAALGRDKNRNLTLNAKINPTDIMHNGSQWHVSAGEVSGNFENLSIKGISIYNDTQRLEVSGKAGKNATDNLNILTKNVEVSTLMGFTKFRAIRFGGKATGSATLAAIFSAPEVYGKFNIDSMKIEDRYVGRGDLDIGWSNDEKAILLDCDIHNDYAEKTKIKGFLSQANDTIMLKADAKKLNINILNDKLRAYVTDLDGHADGTFYIMGSWRKVDLLGNIILNSSLRVKPTNTIYTIENGDISFTKNGISFNNVELKDRKGNKGMLSGVIGHSNFANWTCALLINAYDLMVYDTYGFEKDPFYGTVYGEGFGRIDYTLENGFNLYAELKSKPGSSFVYNSTSASGARDNSFVTFVDNSKKKPQGTDNSRKKSGSYKTVNSKLNLEFILDVTEDLHVKVFTNLNTQDYIDFYGSGKVNAIYDEKNGFSMHGTLGLDRGTYKFTIQDIFPKDFAIDRGSRLLFDGNPFNAGLELTTRLRLPSVPLVDLSPETSKKTTAKVDCVMNIGGTLTKPQLVFDIELPESNEEERDLLASVTSTQEQKNTQFIYLLGLGKFYTYDYNKANSGFESSSAVESLISTTLSGQINNMIGQIIDNDNWNFSGNFSTSERGWNSMEVEGMLSGRLLNNRLLINGNLGYRENPMANRSFIGDFEVQYILDKKGIASLKAYSKTNDRYFTESDLTTQGMGILLKYDFNRWLWWRKKEKEKKKESEETEIINNVTEQ